MLRNGVPEQEVDFRYTADDSLPDQPFPSRSRRVRSSNRCHSPWRAAKNISNPRRCQDRDLLQRLGAELNQACSIWYR